MLQLAIIANNPAGSNVITWLGMVVLALVAAVTLGLWVFVAGGRARRAAQNAEETADDRSLETLRHQRLVAQPSPGPQGAVVAEFEPDDEAAPTER